jgi:site-specific DNA-methyltransferase (adenine-specific)/modification methylase
MKQIPNASVDCIICDLPYGVLNKKSEGGGWDRIIPFEPLWKEYLRITKPNAAIILFCQGMFTAQLMMSQPKLWKYNLIWSKQRVTGFLNANKMPLRSHEDIAVFYRKQPIYNPQMVKCAPHQRNHRKGDGSHSLKRGCYGDNKEVTTIVSDEKFPKSIICFDKEHSVNTFHPTQKPVALIQYLIRTYSNEGDTILDNCMGSGTTAIACIREKRNFIGFELNKEYYEKACKRIQLEMAQPSLF